MFYSPPLPKFKPSWKARKVKALPIESVVKDGSPVIVWRANKVCSGLSGTKAKKRTGSKPANR